MELTRTDGVWSNATLASSHKLTLNGKTKIRVQTKESSGSWTDLIEDQVPNDKKWLLRLNIKAVEENA